MCIKMQIILLETPEYVLGLTAATALKSVDYSPKHPSKVTTLFMGMNIM